MFTNEEYRALKNLLDFCSNTLSLEDEPLFNILYEKIEKEINK